MKSTLLLAATYEPIDIISWQHAIRLLMLDKAELVEEYDNDIRSAYMVIKMPAVIRLVNMFRRHKKKVKFSRIAIYARDNFKCQYCGSKEEMKDLTFDHVVPRSRGGKTNWLNIVTCCTTCNTKKGSRTPGEASMYLKKQPTEPTWVPAINIKLSQRSTPEQWMDYLYWHSSLEADV